MWNRKITTSLYMTLIVRMIMALVISSTLLFILITVTDRVVTKEHEQQAVEMKSTMIDTADGIQNEIREKQLTLAKAQQIEWSQNNLEIIVAPTQVAPYLVSYFIHDFGIEEGMMEGVSPDGLPYLSYVDVLLFEITDAKEKGYLLIYYDAEITVEIISYIVVALFSIFIFFILSLYLLKPVFKYIKQIENGVKIIATEDLTYKIPIVGDHELANLAREINHMGEQIYDKTQKEKLFDQNQKMLITNISHDLKTPLTSIIGYLDIIIKNADSPDKVIDYTQTVKKNGLRLQKLINDLFLYTKLTSDDVKFDLMKIDIDLVIKQIIELRKGKFTLLSANQKIYVNIDVDKLHRIMENLLSNAEKYGIYGKAICIEVFEKEDQVYIKIKNKTEDDLTGKIEFLSNRLYIVDESRKEGSSGLGLAIAKDMVEKMNGQIVFDYVEGVFTVTLKLPILQ